MIVSNIYNFMDYKIRKLENSLYPHPYIKELKENLCEDDYIDFLLGCTSDDYYRTLDIDIQDLVTSYWDLVA